MTTIRTLTVFVLALAFGPGCGGSSGSNPASVTWNLQGLESLGPGFKYEGWIIVDGQPVSTGRFDVDAAGVPSQTTFPITAAQRDRATTFVLSIEPDPDPSALPADTKILGGDFVSGQASLSIGHPAALGDEFMSADGLFILATPTSSDGGDEAQGIWFLNPTGPMAGLTLPTLPAGWAYEGWVVGAGGPVSTGRFVDVAAADSDLGGPAAGMDNPAPPFPGQDFVMPATNLVGLTAVISVEPDPDDSLAPFAFKPLVRGMIAADLAPTTQALSSNVAATAPTGTATLR